MRLRWSRGPRLEGEGKSDEGSRLGTGPCWVRSSRDINIEEILVIQWGVADVKMKGWSLSNDLTVCNLCSHPTMPKRREVSVKFMQCGQGSVSTTWSLSSRQAKTQNIILTVRFRLWQPRASSPVVELWRVNKAHSARVSHRPISPSPQLWNQVRWAEPKVSHQEETLKQPEMEWTDACQRCGGGFYYLSELRESLVHHFTRLLHF